MKRFSLIFALFLLLLGCERGGPRAEMNGPYKTSGDGIDTYQGDRLNKYLEERVVKLPELMLEVSVGSYYHCESYFYGSDQIYYYLWAKCSWFSVIDDALVERKDIDGPVRVGYDDSDGITILSVELVSVNEDYEENLQTLFPKEVREDMEARENELESIREDLFAQADKDLAIYREELKGGALMESWDFEVPQYQNGFMLATTSEGSSYLTYDPQYWISVPNSTAQGLVSSDGNYIIYYNSSDFTLHEYHLSTEIDEILMTFDSTVLSVDIKIRPDSRYVAAVAWNQEDETYRDSLGTKLFLFSMDEEGNVLKRGDHPLVIQGIMSNEGSYSTKQGFYFDEEGDFVYLSYLEGYVDTSIQKILDL